MKPTYLYIKRHSITGLKYFGKTTKADPIAYNGSGTVWMRHIRKHGKKHIETIWCELFTDKEECMEFAEFFSDEMDIVKSDEWANLRPENGIDGIITGTKLGPQTLEHSSKISKALIGRKFSEEHRINISNAGLGKKLPIEVCAKMSASRTGKKRDFLEGHCENLSKGAKSRKILTCPHCGKEGVSSNMTRYHFDNCNILKG
jgi:hypothetical protein